uniref:Reverse transcriptase domain-containing protein n=1 Tax=Nicotiana tabacum TaxID=4097 RepID=A0A1S3Z5A6_TOBAC|nr:PREDICTED: uncharacterized protein LOC107783119 [Nicotiana tabacum]
MDIINNTEADRSETNKAHAEYIRWLDMQESLNTQKANIKWFGDGDRNTSYFHSLLREKRRRLQLDRIKNHKGKWIQGDEKISKAAIRHFNAMFNLPISKLDPSILNCIIKEITEEDNVLLNAIPSEEEIRNAIFNLSATSSAGPDGYNGSFFQRCWDIIKKDIIAFVIDFFQGKPLTKFYTHTCLVLIPKNAATSSFNEFRPISLSNYTNKIITKILSIRLNPLLTKLISANQSDFVKDRLITENVLLAQEIIKSISNTNKGDNVVMKLDMAKAYDRISWNFVIVVLRKFGFAKIWTDMIFNLLSSNGCPHINHLAYADDIVIFSGGNSNSVNLIMNILHSYEKSSGQKVNKDKSFFLTAPKTIAKKTAYFDGMVNSIVKKLNGWHEKLLSYGGKVILIKNVLQALPTYSLSAMCPPKAIFKLIEKYLANFFWGYYRNQKKYH